MSDQFHKCSQKIRNKLYNIVFDNAIQCLYKLNNDEGGSTYLSFLCIFLCVTHHGLGKYHILVTCRLTQCTQPVTNSTNKLQLHFLLQIFAFACFSVRRSVAFTCSFFAAKEIDYIAIENDSVVIKLNNFYTK